jgi:hypothetical protein
MARLPRIEEMTQERQKDPGRLRQAEEIHLEDLAQPVGARLGKVAGGADAGVVDQDVDAAEILPRGVHDPLPVGGAGDVGGEGLQRAAGRLDLGGQFLEQRRGAGDGQNLGAAGGGKPGEGAADPLRGPRNDHSRPGNLTTAHLLFPQDGIHKT